jgi:hypothetical protein
MLDTIRFLWNGGLEKLVGCLLDHIGTWWRGFLLKMVVMLDTKRFLWNGGLEKLAGCLVDHIGTEVAGSVRFEVLSKFLTWTP